MKAGWQRPGRATGMLRCRLRLPAIDEYRELPIATALQAVRRFIDRELKELAASVVEGASFTISAEMRAPNHGARWRPIRRWTQGSSVDEAFARAAAVIDAIPHEERK